MKCPYDNSECDHRDNGCCGCIRSTPTPPPPDDRNDPAEPCIGAPGAQKDYPGFTKLQRACLDLRLPESNTPWLDKLIARKRLEDVAARMLAAILMNEQIMTMLAGEKYSRWGETMFDRAEQLAMKRAAALIERTGKGTV